MPFCNWHWLVGDGMSCNVAMRYFRSILELLCGVAGETTQKTSAGRFPEKSCQIFQPVLVQLIFGRRFFSSSLSLHHLQSMMKWDDSDDYLRMATFWKTVPVGRPTSFPGSADVFATLHAAFRCITCRSKEGWSDWSANPNDIEKGTNMDCL